VLHLASPMTSTAEQCSSGNVVSLLLMLVLHAALLVLCRGDRSRRVCVVALVAAGVNVVAVRDIVFLTIMHQIMGMMATEGAVRALRCPLVLVTSWSEAALLLAIFLANLLIVLGEIVLAFRMTDSGLRPVVFTDAGLGHFASMPFYQKQHAALHALLCILCASVATSLHPRWRHSPPVQQGRVIVEAASIVGVSIILFTHHHGTHEPELASHPTIGALMCIGTALQVLSYVAHLAVPTADGAAPDVTTPLPRGASPVVRMCRALAAYAYLLLAYFLFVDSYMEYLGCRHGLFTRPLSPDGPNGPVSLGLDGHTELATYLALAVIGAALALVVMLLSGAVDAREYGALVAIEKAGAAPHLQALLAAPDAGLLHHDDEARTAPCPADDGGGRSV